MTTTITKNLAERVYRELYSNLVPFWTKRIVDAEHGGFIGRMSNDLQIEENAPRGLINNTRLLWTYSALYRFDPQPLFLELAERALGYLLGHFEDEELAGLFWMVSADGKPLDDKKKMYGHAFFVYALAEYYMATGNQEAFKKAVEYFLLIDKKSHDNLNGGYYETFNRDWSVPEDLRLSEIDMNVEKSMNTHLHIMEAFANLYRIWPDQFLEKRLKEILDVFYRHIIDRDMGHFRLFFDEQWNSQSDIISYGHDIEGSWLLMEAAEVLGDETEMAKFKPVALKMADAVYHRGRDSDGALFYEGDPNGIVDSDKHWWPQAEAVVGFVNAWQLSKEERFLEAAMQCWDFIEKYIIDHERGEWYWKVDKNGRVDDSEPKVSEWKSGYHNTRACLEILSRLESLGLDKTRV